MIDALRWMTLDILSVVFYALEFIYQDLLYHIGFPFLFMITRSLDIYTYDRECKLILILFWKMLYRDPE